MDGQVQDIEASMRYWKMIFRYFNRYNEYLEINKNNQLDYQIEYLTKKLAINYLGISKRHN